MPEKRPRGFAAMDPEQQRQIASMGGRAAHQRGTAHEWDSREAAEAGRRGGKAAHRGGTTRATAAEAANSPPSHAAAQQVGRPASRSEEANGAIEERPNTTAIPQVHREMSRQHGQAVAASTGRSVPQWSENEYENRGMPGSAVTMAPAAGANTGAL